MEDKWNWERRKLRSGAMKSGGRGHCSQDVWENKRRKDMAKDTHTKWY